MKTLVLNGESMGSISGFYREINRVFMASEEWQLGDSLDALDDLLHGAFGAIEGDEPVPLLIPREAAPSFRNDAAPLFRELLAP